MPDMRQSVYATHYYPETRADMAAQPTLIWLTDTCIPMLKQKFGLLATAHNYIMGLSTGGRGVAQVCTHTGNLFKAGAALSGDFDQTIETNDPLMYLTYGPYDVQKERWQLTDNPYNALDKMHVPLYLAYGDRDYIVPPAQSQHYYQKLKTILPASQLHVFKNEGHNFHFWNQAADSAWAWMMTIR